jgi:hypothetical protein
MSRYISAGKGRGLFAKAAFDLGDIVVRDRPLAFVLTEENKCRQAVCEVVLNFFVFLQIST